MGKKSSFEIVLGSYEEFLLGFKYTRKEDAIVQTYATHSHTGSVRSVATTDGLLASGGSDDRIVVYDLHTRKEQCMLTHHNGTVNCLQFTNERTHLITGSEDGTLSIIRVGNWQLEKLWDNAHKGSSILDIAVHSSGKLALTLGADCTLRTWNLIKGRQAYAINLNSKCKDARSLHSIRWAPDGNRFVLIGGFESSIWGIDTGGILQTFEHKSKVCSGTWVSDEKLLLGCEDGNILVVNTESSEIEPVKAHDVRVKCLIITHDRIVSASSNGEIKVWDVSMNELASANAGCRFTCLCVVPVAKVKSEKAEDSVTAVQDNTEQVVSKQRKVCVVVENDEEEEMESPKKKKRLSNKVKSKRKSEAN